MQRAAWMELLHWQFEAAAVGGGRWWLAVVVVRSSCCFRWLAVGGYRRPGACCCEQWCACWPAQVQSRVHSIPLVGD